MAVGAGVEVGGAYLLLSQTRPVPIAWMGVVRMF